MATHGIPEEALDAAIRNGLLLRSDNRSGDGWFGGRKQFASTILEAAIGRPCLQRKRAMAERAHLDSDDGHTAERFDQFYRDHQLLLVLFRALAVMPITRSSPGKMTFSWRSSATWYAIAFWSANTVVVVLVGAERVRILQTTTQFDEYVYAIVFVLFLVPHFWIPFVGWGVANQVAVYKTMWASFQVRYYRVTGRRLRFPGLQMAISLMALACLLCAIAFLLSLTMLLDGFALWHTFAYYHIVMMINMNCTLWYINCRAIRNASQSMAECFRADVEEECTAPLVSQYRFLWLNLSELLQALGNAYARTYATYCLFMFVNITIAVYAVISELFDRGLHWSFKEVGLCVDTVYCSALLFMYCDCSDRATRLVAQGMQDTLLSIELRQVDWQTQREIDHFIQAIEMNPAVVSLKGYANVNRELLVSTATQIAVYLIVLLQFKLSLISHQQIPSMLNSATHLSNSTVTSRII